MFTPGRWIRRLLQKCYPLLPRDARHALMRRAIRLPIDNQPALRFKLAETTAELAAAFRLTYQSYLRDGITLPVASEMRITRYHLLPTTAVLIALDGDEVVGTMTIIQDDAFGVPMQEAFDLSELRESKLRVAECSSLAIADRYRNDGRVLFPLISLCMQYTWGTLRLDGLVCSMHPNHAELYESLILFRRLSQTVVDRYAFANNRPAVGLCLRFTSFLTHYHRVYGKQPLEKNMLDFFFRHRDPRIELPPRVFPRSFDPMWTPERFRYFSRLCPELFAGLTDAERAVLLAHYPEPVFHQVLPQPRVRLWPRQPREVRFTVLTDGRFIGLLNGQLRVENVSRHGLRLQLMGTYWMAPQGELEIRLGDRWVSLTVEMVWTDGEGTFGVRILDADGYWQHFIDYLDGVREGVAEAPTGSDLRAA